MTTCFVIPAYEPSPILIELLTELIKKTPQPIFVVDDGSKDNSIFHESIFKNKRITLLKHAENLGKGAALKTAFNYILIHHPTLEGCVTLDADGQHTISDAVKVSVILQEKKGLVLGVRNFSFSAKDIPLKSRVGNLLTRCIWWFKTGKKITDTQTGLRGIPVQLMKKCLHISANRYEFEMEMLLKAQELNLSNYEIPISTIYINNNRGSHFNPFFDSLKIYFVIFRFSISSFISFLVDYTFFTIFIMMFSFSMGSAFLAARLISLIFNYNMNKKIVFGIKSSYNSFLKYMLIFTINLYLGFVIIDYFKIYGYNAFYSKIVVEGVLFFFNFFLQKEWVFKKGA